MSNGPRLARALCLLAFAAASPAAGQPAHLLRDIVAGHDEFAGDSNPGDLTAFGSKVAFTATEQSIGREVWVSDSESRRTYALGDICKGVCNEIPEIVGAVGSTLFFVEGRRQNQPLLWASDGTARGTHPVLDETGVMAPALLPGRLVFLVDREFGLELWRTDGTPGGTTEVATIPGAFDFTWVHVSGNRAFFMLRVSTAYELWTTDGSAAGTRKLAGAGISFPSFNLHAATATHVFFVTSTPAGEELWASDGTVAGTRAVSSFTAPEPFQGTYWLKPIGSRVYFFADDVTHGRELWRSDGSPQGTVRTTEFGFSDAFENLANDDQVEELNGNIIFFATDGFTPLQLWTSTGSPSSTRVLPGVCSDPCFLDDEPWLRRLGNRLFFPAVSRSSFATEIWATDGTAAGSGPLIGSCAGECGGHASEPQVLGNRLYFLADGNAGRELWSSDGTAAGTREISGFEDPDPFEDVFPFPTPEVAAAGGRIWFAAVQSPYGQELWSTAGTPETTELAADIGRGGASSDPASFAAFGDRVLFAAARCDDGGHDLWVSDGSASTQRLSQFVSSCFGFDLEQPIVVSGQYGYFWRDDFAETLWRTDGTAAGTIALTTLPELHFPGSLLPVEGGVAFVVEDLLADTNDLWRSDGTPAGTQKRLDLPSFPQGPFADGQGVYFLAPAQSFQNRQVWRADLGSGALLQLTAFGAGELLDGVEPSFAKLGSQVYFWLQTSGHHTALWRTDGTSAGTAAAFELPAAALPVVFGMSNVAGALYFQAGSSGITSYQLWRTDGSEAGTTRLGTFTTLNPNDHPAFELAAANGRVFFIGDDLTHGREPWSTDGTLEGTRLLRDVAPGTGASSPLEITAAHGRIFFTAADDLHGRELWQSDGTEAGTRLVHDIGPDALSGEPMHLTVAGSNLFFAADDGLAGREPWVLPLAGSTACAAADAVLCLGAGRFRVEAVWRDFAGNTGVGHAAPLTADTGTFWFFSPSNVEVILKVLDGRGLNDHQWVFYGALSSVEYTLTVTDTQTGAVRRYFNPAGRLASVGDTEAFGPRGAATLRRQSRTAAAVSPPPLVAERRDEAVESLCVASATRLCLAGGRFAVEVAWRDFAGNSGVGTATTLSSDTGDFWFFSADNIELVVKVLDGRPVNGKFWLFYGALSSVGYTLTVTDTQTGVTRTYQNPSGRLASVADTSAF